MNAAVAKRYGQALLQIGQEKNSIDRYQEDLKLVVDTMENSAELKDVLTSQTVSVDEKKNIVKQIFADKVDANEKATVEADMNAIKTFLEAHPNAEDMTEAEVAELKSMQEKLTQSAQSVFAKMYDQAQAAQGAAGPDMSNMGGNAGAPEDDVVDADFKEV